jgi:hypothetical protein
MENLAEYKMERHKHSLVLNNFKFDNSSKHLWSGPQDSINIVGVLQNVVFQVELRENNTAEVMQQIMNEFASKDYTESDCFLCLIISHGGQIENKGPVMYGTDGQNKIIKDLIEPFKSNQTLEGKPKIFLINACQGSENVQTLSSMKNHFLNHSLQKNSNRNVDPTKTAKEAEIFLHYSTVLDYF